MTFITIGLAVNALLGKMQFVDCHDPILDRTSEPLTLEEIHDPDTQSFLDKMIRFANGEQSDQQKHVLVGLAAPQIGHSIRVILVDVGADGKGGVSQLQCYINPEIIEVSKETNEWYEGCYSTGLVKGIVRRPSQVTIRALDQQGREIEETHTGYVARIFQHEIDHLNGVRFPDRVPENEVLHIVKAEEMPAYRNSQGWRAWPKTIAQKEWKTQM